jgi:membrane protein YdbS with pleckstrin-like domain
MALKDKKLWEGSPHGYKFFKLGLARTITLLVLLWILFPVIGSIAFIVSLAILEIVLITYCFYLWKTHTYEIKENGIFFRSGILYKVNKFIPFYKLTNYTESQGILQQIFGIGNVALHTAGMGNNMPELTIWDINKQDLNKAVEILEREIGKVQKGKGGD